MTHEQLYQDLEQIFTQLGIEIRTDWMDDELESTGGLCVLKNRTLLVVNRKLNPFDRTALLMRCLRSFDLDRIYIKPLVRAVIEKNMSIPMRDFGVMQILPTNLSKASTHPRRSGP